MGRQLEDLTMVHQTVSADGLARVIVAKRSDGFFTYFEEVSNSLNPLPDFVTGGNREGTFVLRGGGIFATLEDAEVSAIQHIPWMSAS
jgi:hypothetical protein